MIFCTFIHAKCNYLRRRSIWADLVSISLLSRALSAVVLSASECCGTVPALLPCSDFANMVLIGLCDIPFIGSPTSPHILKHLDRVLVNPFGMIFSILPLWNIFIALFVLMPPSYFPYRLQYSLCLWFSLLIHVASSSFLFGGCS